MRGSGGFPRKKGAKMGFNFHFTAVNPVPEGQTEFITVEKAGEPSKVVPRSAMENYISLDYKITNREGRVLYDPVGYPYQIARKPDWTPVIVENAEHMAELIEQGYTIEDAEGQIVAKPAKVEKDFGEQLRESLNAPVQIKNRDSGEIRTIKRMDLAQYNTKYAYGADMWYEIDNDGNEVKDSWKPAANYGHMAFKPVNPVPSSADPGKGAADPGKGGSDQAGPFRFWHVN